MSNFESVITVSINRGAFVHISFDFTLFSIFSIFRSVLVLARRTLRYEKRDAWDLNVNETPTYVNCLFDKYVLPGGLGTYVIGRTINTSAEVDGGEYDTYVCVFTSDPFRVKSPSTQVVFRVLDTPSELLRPNVSRIN